MYNAPNVWSDWGSNPWPPDHDITFEVPETPVLTKWSLGTTNSVEENVLGKCAVP